MNDVRRQLIVYERNGRILKWHDRQIPPGSDWRGQIDERLNAAQIVLLFLSPHFIESRYCYEVEGETALRRRNSKEAEVIPIILRPCAWQDTPFGTLQALPRDAVPVSRWQDRDEACLNVATGVMAAVDNVIEERKITPNQSESETYEPDQKDEDILRYLYRSDVVRLLHYIAEAVHLDPTETEYRLNRLITRRFVRRPGLPRVSNPFPEYRLIDKGIEWVIDDRERDHTNEVE
ncbi:MAG TPA: hypothetical protein DCK93_02295 [Blastocatellia bacterium]|jgi:hypothetical protein|nr:hypothetical protein [Blastocatellia bacterium]